MSAETARIPIFFSISHPTIRVDAQSLPTGRFFSSVDSSRFSFSAAEPGSRKLSQFEAHFSSIIKILSHKKLLRVILSPRLYEEVNFCDETLFGNGVFGTKLWTVNKHRLGRWDAASSFSLLLGFQELSDAWLSNIFRSLAKRSSKFPPNNLIFHQPSVLLRENPINRYSCN